jgi:MerR family transcriptional regulator, light-induced transcriptional regulator
MDALPRETAPLKFFDLNSRLLSKQVSEEFFIQYPNLEASWSQPIREYVIKDTLRDLEYLDFCMLHKDLPSFSKYLKWATRVRISRGVLEEYLFKRYKILMEILENSLSDKENLIAFQSLNTVVNECRKNYELPVSESPFNDEDQLIGNLYLNWILKGDRHEALDIIKDAIMQGLDMKDLYLKIFQPAMEEIGRQWELNQISVSQEHLATAITQYVMAHCYYHFIPMKNNSSKGKVCLSGVGGELHEMGMQIVGGLLETDDWNVTYLGTNAPSESIFKTLQSSNFLAIGISVTMYFNLPIALELIRKIRACPELEGLKIIVGGNAFYHKVNGENNLKALNIDGWARNGITAMQAFNSIR